MWTTQIKPESIVKHKASFDCAVNFYKNGEFIDEFSFKQSLSVSDLKQKIRNQLSQYKAIDELVLPEGDIDVTLPTPPVTPEPTQAEINLAEFMKTYERWTSVKKAIDMGVLTGNETQVVALKVKVQADFKPAYLAVI